MKRSVFTVIDFSIYRLEYLNLKFDVSVFDAFSHHKYYFLRSRFLKLILPKTISVLRILIDAKNYVLF